MSDTNGDHYVQKASSKERGIFGHNISDGREHDPVFIIINNQFLFIHFHSKVMFCKCRNVALLADVLVSFLDLFILPHIPFINKKKFETRYRLEQSFPKSQFEKIKLIKLIASFKLFSLHFLNISKDEQL